MDDKRRKIVGTVLQSSNIIIKVLKTKFTLHAKLWQLVSLLKLHPLYATLGMGVTSYFTAVRAFFRMTASFRHLYIPQNGSRVRSSYYP